MGRKPLIDKKVMVSLFIVAIMILSTFGFILSYSTSERQKQEYNGYKFIITELGMKTEVNDKEIYFNYFPTQLEDINLTEPVKNLLTNIKVITVTYDPNSDYATGMAEAQFLAEQGFQEYAGVYVTRGLTDTKQGNYTTPELTCLNATASNPVLEFKESNTTRIEFKNNCILAYASSENDFSRLYERILYSLLGIME